MATRKRKPRRQPGHLLEVDLFDLHLAKLAWKRETGSNYDTAIAESVAQAAAEDLISMTGGIEIDRVLFPLGNDFLHYDSLAGLTTAGTPQDRDSRYHRMFERGIALTIALVEQFKRVAPVEVLVLPGNHDTASVWALGKVVEAHFRDDKHVEVDTSPRLRKYVPFGENLIGFTHGDKEKAANLPLIMATEVPALWGRSTFREFHLGHFHKKREMKWVPVDSYNGVTVRYLRSLSGTDAWHYAQGYVGEPRAAEAFVYHPERGLRAHLTSNALPSWYA